MSYSESTLDGTLRKNFQNSYSYQFLRSIELRGVLRGISDFKINLDYPIIAIAGKNGAGKSTILALACCAFHNEKTGFIHNSRKTTYYTFADFFIQHADEVTPDGLEVWYGIAHNAWRVTKDNPDKEKVAYQARKKKKGGKWNNYDRRVRRNVVFLGIERIVPHYEKSQSKSYRKSFSQSLDKGWEEDVRNCVGRVLGKNYDSFQYSTHSKYRLPITSSNGRIYSGFNMGAGENALFELFSILFAIPEGGLIVIDEIELGLHAEAQTKLIKEMKEVCRKRKLQIICTTHSKEVFEQLPDDARFFVESNNGKTEIISGVSPEYAFSKMSAKNHSELSVFVEDNVAKTILESALSNNIRTRISIEVIGSATSLARQLGVNYQRSKPENILVIFDGDQQNKKKDNEKVAVSSSEARDKSAFLEWYRDRAEFLPSENPPERWLVEQGISNIETLANLLKIGEGNLRTILNSVLGEDPHSMLYLISERINIPTDMLLLYLCSVINSNKENFFKNIEDKINCLLNK